MKTFWKVILCLSVMAPRGFAHSQISGFWRRCRLSSVSGSRRVLSLWLFYMQTSVSLNWCELQLGASAGRQWEVWHGPFWVRWRPIVLQHSESSVKVWLCMIVMTRSCAACCVRKGLIRLMLCNANLQDLAVFAMWYFKVSWSSKITPRFQTELDGVIVDESIWMVNYAVESEWQGSQVKSPLFI